MIHVIFWQRSQTGKLPWFSSNDATSLRISLLYERQSIYADKSSWFSQDRTVVEGEPKFYFPLQGTVHWVVRSLVKGQGVVKDWLAVDQAFHRRSATFPISEGQC